MTERQAEYITRKEVSDSLEMLGKGYEPALEIETPRKVTERRGGKLIEAERAAFVKIYTSFKKELKAIQGGDLKVWLYLALSVNRFTNDARPGLRRIADDLDMAVNTVRTALERLEEKGLLDIEKIRGVTNAYRPSDYVSVKKESVSKIDTLPETVSIPDTTVSKNGGTVSTPLLQIAQLEEPELTREEQSAPPSSFFIPETIKDAYKHPDIRLFEKVSGVFPGSKHYREIVDVMQHLCRKHGKGLESYLEPFWSAWSKGRTKDGKPYSKTNPAWLTEWAFQGEIPQTNGHEPQATFTPIPDVEATRKALEEKGKLDALIMQQRLAKGMSK